MLILKSLKNLEHDKEKTLNFLLNSNCYLELQRLGFRGVILICNLCNVDTQNGCGPQLNNPVENCKVWNIVEQQIILQAYQAFDVVGNIQKSEKINDFESIEYDCMLKNKYLSKLVDSYRILKLKTSKHYVNFKIAKEFGT